MEITKMNKQVRITEEVGIAQEDTISTIYYKMLKVQVKDLLFWHTVKEYCFYWESTDDQKQVENDNEYYTLCAEELYEHIIKNE